MEKKYKENKLALFFKKNIYAILMVVCLLAIVGLVTYTVLITNTKKDVPAAVVDAGGNPVDIGGQDNKTDDKDTGAGDQLLDPNAGSEPNADAAAFVMDTPIADAEVLKD